MTHEELITKINNASSIIANNARKSQSASWLITSAVLADAMKYLDPKIKLRKSRKEKLEQIQNEKTSE